MIRTLLCLLLTACGASAPQATEPVREVAAPAPTHLRIDGELAHPTPIADLDAELLAVHRAFVAIVDAEISPPADPSDEAIGAWTRGELRDFLAAHRERLTALEQQAGALLQRDHPADRRFAALVVGRAWERFHALVVSVPAPSPVATDEVLMSAYQNALAGSALPLAHRAAAAYGVCAQQPEMPGTESWAAECGVRAERLAALTAPPPPAASTAPPPREQGPGMIGMLRSDAAGNAGLGVRTCQTDADCLEGTSCRQFSAALTEDGVPIMACLARPLSD